VKSLAVRNVTVRMGRLETLHEVGLTLEAGHPCILAGPNGAGKTTLIKVLLGLVRPDAGDFALDGAPITINNEWKARVGYLPEAVAFSENLNGQQVLRFFARARGVARIRATEVLERVGLAHAARRPVRAYSRGMRQRLGLAVAILAEPTFLILDEPTVGLDHEGLGVLWSVIKEWREAGRLALISTHDLALLEQRVDDICVLRAGRVLVQGSADALRQKACLDNRVLFDLATTEGAEGSGAQESDETRCFREAIERWGKGRVEASPGRLCVEVASDAILDLMKLQSEFPGAVRRLRVEEPSLDRIYDELLGTL